MTTTLSEAVTRFLTALRADLLLTMRLLDRDETREAHMRLAMTVAALDVVIDPATTTEAP